MKCRFIYTMQIVVEARCQVALAVMIILLCSPASASLGGSLESVHRDNVGLNGDMHLTLHERFSIYTINIASGTTIREFISPAGTVFGVAWEGPVVPELSRLLGDYFRQYSEALHAQRKENSWRRPVTIRLPELVFETAGHMGHYYGRAYTPQNLPQEVRAEEVF